MKTIPLHGRDGSLRAVACVDDADWPLVVPHSWHYEHGYVRGHVGGRKVYMHRFIMGAARGVEVDHRDGDGLNNRRENLRLASHAQNGQNHSGWRKTKTSSRWRGVAWHKRKRKWVAYCYVDGARHHIGYFDNEQEAANTVSGFRQRHLPFTEEARREAA